MTDAAAPLVVHWPLVRGAAPFSLLSFLPCNVPTWEEIDETIEALARQDSHPLPRRRRQLFIGPIEDKAAGPPPRPPRPPRPVGGCHHLWIASGEAFEGRHLATCRWCFKVTTYTPTGAQQ
jgi:hypothetical protein